MTLFWKLKFLTSVGGLQNFKAVLDEANKKYLGEVIKWKLLRIWFYIKKMDSRIEIPYIKKLTHPTPRASCSEIQKLWITETCGWALGPWGDLSHDFLLLLRSLTEKRVEAMARGKRRVSEAGELGRVMREVRRAMSIVHSVSEEQCPPQAWETCTSWARGKGSMGEEESCREVGGG